MTIFGRRGGTASDRAAVPGEVVLAAVTDADQVRWVATRTALHRIAAQGPATGLAWHEIHAAEWDAEVGVLTVREVGEFGRARSEHRAALVDAGRFLGVVNERVRATVLLTRHVTLPGAPEGSRPGVRVIARRPADGGAVLWLVDHDEGVDPTDPRVVRAVDRALAAARDEVGLG